MTSTDGSIRVDYGYINRSLSGDMGKHFHTRQITFPMLFTVYHTFEPHSLDLLRFQPSTSRIAKPLANGHVDHEGSLSPPPFLSATPRKASFAINAEDDLQRRLKDEADDEHCLVAISMRNVFGVPFEITLQRKGPASSKCLHCRTLCLESCSLLRWLGR
jgi:hypothetical protein